MRIYLVGYMGCGKSTLGKILSAELNLSLIDLDKYIEERNCKTVPQLFKTLGEEGFRYRERKALEEVAGFDNVIVATGGGAPCFFDNMDLMNRTGLTIFLDIDIPVLAERLYKSKTVRPLIAGKSKQELISFIGESLGKRRPYYEQAQLIISNTEGVKDKILSVS